MPDMLRIATRKSPLAIWQAEEVQRHLKKAGADSELIELSEPSADLVEFVNQSFSLLAPNGVVKVCCGAEKKTSLRKTMRYAGYELIEDTETGLSARRPSWDSGTTAKISLKAEAASSWTVDAEDEVIDEDALLADEDEQVETTTMTKDACNTSGKKKACKDCSCGLAEQLAQNDAAELPKSSCGSCYLGDAFRCSTCPYLGQPAFEPGDTVKLKL